MNSCSNCTQTDIGILTACFHINGERKDESYCIVQLLERVDSFGIQLCNEFDCPLLTITTLFRSVPSNCISHSVSIMHECSSSCTFEHADTTTVVECEHVTSRKLVFVHDFSNNLYAFNVYCMHCSDLHSN